MSPADHEKFVKEYFPIYAKFVSGTAPCNGKEMLALLETEQLKIIASKQTQIAFNEQNRQFIIDTSKGSISADYLINATGTGCNIEANPLFRDMKEKGLIETNAMGAIIIDTETFQIGGQENCYAVGAITYPSNLAAYAVEAAAIDVHKFVPQMVASIPKKAQENKFAAISESVTSISSTSTENPQQRYSCKL